MTKGKKRTRKKVAKQGKDSAQGCAATQESNPTPEAPPLAEAPAGAETPEETPGTEELEQARQQLLRMRADFDNFRKRTVREREDIYRRANEDLLEELLPVLDHMELSIKAASEHGTEDAVLQGFRLVNEQLLAALGKHGLEPVDADGIEFDPNLHEAISHIPSAEIAENHVITQTRRGYRLGDYLLRAAQVVVSCGAPETTGENGEA